MDENSLRTRTLKGRTIVSGHCRGTALVAKKPISFLGGVDPNTGTIIEKNHDLEGKKLKNTILCFPHGHGSTVGSYVLYALSKKNLAPKAIVNQTADPVVVVGAIIAEIPILDKIDVEEIRTGDKIEIDGEGGTVEILEKRQCT